jgi:flavin-dependent dehydrogenase
MEADFHVGHDDVLKATNGNPSILHMLPVKGRLAYGWIFPKREQLAIGIAGGALHMRSLRPMFESFRKSLEQRLELDLTPEIRRTHFLGGWGLRNKNVTHRVMLIGDAAGWVDPMMGEGIAYAMMSGKVSAEVAQKAIHSNRVDEDYLSNYQSICAKKCGDSFGMAAWAGSRGLDFAESLLSKASQLSIASELMAMVARGEICYSDIPAFVARKIPKEIPGIIKRVVTSRLHPPLKKPS